LRTVDRALPLDTADCLLGLIVVARRPGAPSFPATELAVAADFAARIGVALELQRARALQQRVLLSEDLRRQRG
jgi:two-component system, NarL family, sensor histidine kinase DevS